MSALAELSPARRAKAERCFDAFLDDSAELLAASAKLPDQLDRAKVMVDCAEYWARKFLRLVLP